MSIAWEENNNTIVLETQAFSIDPIINQKIKSAVQGLQKSIQNYFLEFPTERDKELVADFLIESTFEGVMQKLFLVLSKCRYNCHTYCY